MALNKFGQGDSIGSVFAVFIFVITIAIFYLIVSSVADIPLFKNNVDANNIGQAGKDLFTGMDWAIPGVLFAFNIGSLILLFYLRSNAILFFMVLIMLPLTIIVAAGVSNAFESVDLALSLSANFPISAFVMSKLPLLLLIFDLVGGVMLYSKSQ